jgi:preprotein translocase subunit SecA
MGGYAMMRGALAEMQTGEGKTLTATLTAAAMALTGRPVHVVTVNDYLAARDAAEMTPVYARLGLSVGVVTGDMAPEARRAAYRADITYCSNKELAFDHLRDRITGGAEAGPLARRADLLHLGAAAEDTLLRGLAFALVDEADSVFVDEARTPLVLSGEGPPLYDPAYLHAAAALAGRLERGRDWVMHGGERRAELTGRGAQRLGALAEGGPLAHRVLREELALKALTARHVLHRDVHYLVQDAAVQIIDEYTGRVMQDRFWTEGLHQLVEIKEGLPLSRGRVTLARTTYQRFFRRYDRLAAMTGTAREVARELWQVYRLPVATIPPHRPIRRVVRRARVVGSEARKWTLIAEAARERAAAGVPVLIGTRSVAASARASEALTRLGVDHAVLSAAQDAEEARKIGQAGQPGRVTVATNMAGRGADIRLAPGVAARGGLCVLMSERHDSARIDRQLVGRAGRQGDPGLCMAILSREDPLLASEGPALARLLARVPLSPFGALAQRMAQRRAERLHARMRRDLLRQDEVLNDAMSFVGAPE